MLWRLLDPIHFTATEEVDLERVDHLERKIVREQKWTQPIAVHERRWFVMDGHHRLAVALRLNLDRVPAVLLDYDRVRVEAWREKETITPEDILAMARSGGRFPIKTTRHLFEPALPECDIPLSRLYRSQPNRRTGGAASVAPSG